MKRDMDLVRKIMLFIEESPTQSVKSIEIDDISKDVINYHLDLMVDGGLIITHALSISGQSIIHTQIELTWKGNDFLDACRSDTIWNNAKSKIIEKGGAFTTDILLALLKTGIAAQYNITL